LRGKGHGNANVRFTLCNSAWDATAISAVASPITTSFSGIADGRITTALDFGSAIDANEARWLNIEVENPPGSGFVTLAPRTLVTPVPQARVAQTASFANAATTATTATTVPWSGVTGVPNNVTSSFSAWIPGPSGSITFSGGNVGIGVAAPAALLDVGGRLKISGPIQNTASAVTTGDMGLYSGNATQWLRLVTNNAPINFYTNYSDGSGTTNGAPAMLITSTGFVGIGTGTPTQRLTVSGNVLANNVTVPSSGRFKHNVLPMDDALEKLLKLEGVTFDWNAEYAVQRPGREHDIGFVAEDVAKVFPEVVFRDEQGRVTGMDYSRLTAVAVQAIKQQQAQRAADLARFEAQLAKREAENAALRARLDAIEAALNQRR
jgi:hypothetical protein